MLGRRRVLGLFGVLALAGCAADGPDTAELDRWLRQYVDLLNAGDPVALGEHVGDAGARLGRFGGRGFTVEAIAIGGEVPRVYRARIDVRDRDGRAVSMTEVVEWEDGRWHLAPLTATVPSGAASTESPAGR
ncbi:hypothetical protein ACTG9Q_09235 [Actinokineospora sp. 24-640]